jgi:predicted TPR repeat methyltransferase
MNSPAASRTDPVQPALRDVRERIAAGDLRAAAAALNAIAGRHPTDPRIYLAGISLAEAAHNPEGALDAANRAVGLAPKWAPATMELAAVLSRQNKHAEALARADEAVQLAPDALPLIERATAIANNAGDHLAAYRYLQLASRIAPDDVSIKRSIASNLSERQEYAEARNIFQAVLDSVPEDMISLLGRAFCTLKLGEYATAEAYFTHLMTLQPDHQSHAYYLAIARGETPPTQPIQMIEHLFDSYAERFDHHLVGGLKYRVPRRAAEVIREHHGGQPFGVLDLGCGTGLLGVYLGAPGGALVGVDVSSAMIREAGKHGLYTRLLTNNLVDVLRETAAEEYDVVTACDVFIYVGDLAEVVPDAYRVLAKGGHLIFSCETASEDEPDMVLRPSNRYAHKESSIRRLCSTAGFDRVDIEAINVRNEGNEPLAGFLVTARKS